MPTHYNTTNRQSRRGGETTAPPPDDKVPVDGTTEPTPPVVETAPPSTAEPIAEPAPGDRPGETTAPGGTVSEGPEVTTQPPDYGEVGGSRDPSVGPQPVDIQEPFPDPEVGVDYTDPAFAPPEYEDWDAVMGEQEALIAALDDELFGWAQSSALSIDPNTGMITNADSWIQDLAVHLQNNSIRLSELSSLGVDQLRAILPDVMAMALGGSWESIFTSGQIDPATGLPLDFVPGGGYTREYLQGLLDRPGGLSDLPDQLVLELAQQLEGGYGGDDFFNTVTKNLVMDYEGDLLSWDEDQAWGEANREFNVKQSELDSMLQNRTQLVEALAGIQEDKNEWENQMYFSQVMEGYAGMEDMFDQADREMAALYGVTIDPYTGQPVFDPNSGVAQSISAIYDPQREQALLELERQGNLAQRTLAAQGAQGSSLHSGAHAMKDAYLQSSLAQSGGQIGAEFASASAQAQYTSLMDYINKSYQMKLGTIDNDYKALEHMAQEYENRRDWARAGALREEQQRLEEQRVGLMQQMQREASLAEREFARQMQGNDFEFQRSMRTPFWQQLLGGITSGLLGAGSQIGGQALGGYMSRPPIGSVG